MAQCLRTVDDLIEDPGLGPRTCMEVHNSPVTPVQRDLHSSGLCVYKA